MLFTYIAKVLALKVNFLCACYAEHVVCLSQHKHDRFASSGGELQNMLNNLTIGNDVLYTLFATNQRRFVIKAIIDERKKLFVYQSIKNSSFL